MSKQDAMSKKRKLPDQVPEYAMISCCDEPERLLEVDVNLLSEFNCRLYKIIAYDPPSVQCSTGITFWRSSMTRAMLLTMTRSLLHGELSLGKQVSLAEAMTTFEHENIPIGVPSERKAEVALLQAPPVGIAFQKRSEKMSDFVLRTSEQVAHAIARWPRLEKCMDAALSGAPVAYTCTSKRMWVRFCKKPHLPYDKSDCILHVVRKWPRWCLEMLRAVGIIRQRLITKKLIDPKGWDGESYAALQTAVLGDALSFFFSTQHDWPKFAWSKATRKEQDSAEAFANGLRNTVLDSVPSREQGTSNVLVAQRDMDSEEVTYARSCVTLVDSLVHDAPNLATMYAGSCGDEHGKSPERAQLARSLQQRGIKVIRWAEDDKGPAKPLNFPPAWSEGVGHGLGAVLLEFS